MLNCYRQPGPSAVGRRVESRPLPKPKVSGEFAPSADVGTSAGAASRVRRGAVDHVAQWRWGNTLGIVHSQQPPSGTGSSDRHTGLILPNAMPMAIVFCTGVPEA